MNSATQHIGLLILHSNKIGCLLKIIMRQGTFPLSPVALQSIFHHVVSLSIIVENIRILFAV